jgi:lysozyme
LESHISIRQFSSLLAPLLLAPALLSRVSAMDPPVTSHGGGEPSPVTIPVPSPVTSPAPSTAVPRAAPGQGSLQVSAGPYALTPRRRALLATIRYAEGTWTGGTARGYRLLYGGGLFASLSRHPQITVRRRYVSAAAGAYQFLPPTWNRVARRLGLRDFGPRNQDMAALYLVERRGALATLDRHGLNGRVLERLAPEWASLPNRRGASAYGQPVKSAQELQQFYASSLQRAIHQPDATPAASPEASSEASPDASPDASPEATG